MTVEEVRERVECIRKISRDAEQAHSMEDELHAAVLVVIAQGAANAAELASIALESRKIGFARWCA
jgi:hypothetical protein